MYLKEFKVASNIYKQLRRNRRDDYHSTEFACFSSVGPGAGVKSRTLAALSPRCV
jgi:hypothetical protein